MNRRGVLLILVPGLVFFHFLLHLGFGLGAGAPDFLAVAVLLAARELGMGYGAGFGFFFGLLEDSFSVLAFGGNALALTLVGTLGARTRDLFVGESLSFHLGYLAVGIWARRFIHWAVAGEGMREPFMSAVLTDGTVAALYGAVVGTLLLIPFASRRRGIG
jgi:rod shape-determining protein MreD